MARPQFGGHKTRASRPCSCPVFICYSKFAIQLLAALFFHFFVCFFYRSRPFLALWHQGIGLYRRLYPIVLANVRSKFSALSIVSLPQCPVPLPGTWLLLCLTSSRRCRRRSNLNVLALNEKTCTTSRDPDIAKRLPLAAEEPGRRKR
jgi:hypothetical protein